MSSASDQGQVGASGGAEWQRQVERLRGPDEGGAVRRQSGTGGGAGAGGGSSAGAEAAPGRGGEAGESKAQRSLSQWRGLARASEQQVAFLTERLETRGAQPEQVRLRSAYLDAFALRPGESVLEVGCGSGAVLREVARRVGAAGCAVGLDPSAGLVAAAADLAEGEGIAIVPCAGDGLALPFASDRFDAALTATTIAHVDDAGGFVRELVRVVRPGGRVGLFEQDPQSLTFAHPEPALARRVLAAYVDHAFVDGWIARRLPELLRAAGLVDVETIGLLGAERNPRHFIAGMALQAAEIAERAGAITAAERARYVAPINERREAGAFFGTLTHVFAWGRKPE
ncbi:MAG: methyltransferase domain-containing protein [Chloroflexi bacterium]|nr:methyltransferase domain-containing protein [Chloroflexota bacterium]